MTEQELKEIYDLLEASRLNPQWCDTPVISPRNPHKLSHKLPQKLPKNSHKLS